ncbi:hypothetical protein LOAG_12105 [Loa loa]|uniref:Uncharacterized protein n=1 Tax=Loa loa TaxID=7209 RepID=A0A1S0TMB4_LOALO|nr:hypothetical protein LOAG_12105 [Loa loa]EFO16403.1 hypothetical protein LOAG_12105 [Loa loa]
MDQLKGLYDYNNNWVGDNIIDKEIKYIVDENKSTKVVVVVTHPATMYSANILVNKPDVNINDEKKLVILNLMTNFSNLDDCAKICDRITTLLILNDVKILKCK